MNYENELERAAGHDDVRGTDLAHVLRNSAAELVRLREANAELLAALEPANEILGQLRGYMLSIAHGELGPIDMIEFLRNRVHEIESVEAHARAAIAKATA
jgi:hypothetical protein